MPAIVVASRGRGSSGFRGEDSGSPEARARSAAALVRNRIPVSGTSGILTTTCAAESSVALTTVALPFRFTSVVAPRQQPAGRSSSAATPSRIVRSSERGDGSVPATMAKAGTVRA